MHSRDGGEQTVPWRDEGGVDVLDRGQEDVEWKSDAQGLGMALLWMRRY
jgi:hypothetical protein